MTTSVEFDSDKFKTYRYQVSVRYIPAGGTEDDEINITKDLKQFRIIRDYDEQIIAYFRITPLLSIRHVNTIKNTWKTARVFITVKNFIVENINGVPVERSTGESMLRDIEFRIMNGDFSSPPSLNGDTDTVDYNMPNIEYPMELVPVAPLMMNKTIRPRVYQNVKMDDVIVAMMHNHYPGGATYVIATSPSDNTRSFNAITVPPLSFANAIRYLDDTHGIYRGKLCVFMDAHRGYMTSSTKIIKNPAWLKPTNVTIEVISDTNTTQMVGGSAYEAESRTARLRTSVPPFISTEGILKSEISGRAVQLINTSFNTHVEMDCNSWSVDELATAGGAFTADGDKERIFWQKYDNPLIGDRMKILTRENYAPITFTFEGIDVMVLEPTITWRVVTPNKNSEILEGDWRISATEIVFSKIHSSSNFANVNVFMKMTPASLES